jgi:ubiquinone/menaquinone biosynthesis C-methylase UbiE
MSTVILIAGAAIILAVLLYWLLITTEGTYLGAGVVTLLYDWTAKGYDRLKDVQFFYEVRFLGLPLREALAHVPAPRLLDVATGTGRLARALLRGTDYPGTVVGVDRSRPMMGATPPCSVEEGARVAFLQSDARALPFAAETFDGVACLEALEFMPRAEAALREMMRVLKPGGVLLLSNRLAPDALFFPGRLCRRGHLERRLAALGLIEVRAGRWQAHYDLVWARKAERNPRAA